jgi:hypothetical protein
MSEVYISVIEWCLENPKFSFWIAVFSGSLLTLWLLYLILTNFRLHAYIGILKKDKDRLMQEKDLIRLGKSIQEPDSSQPSEAPIESEDVKATEEPKKPAVESI